MKMLLFKLVARALDVIGLKNRVIKLIDFLMLIGVPEINPRVLKIIPHDESAFTQGLVFDNEDLYESTGSPVRSTLRQISPVSGDIINKIDITDDFAEGIAIFNENLYQLSWKSGIARVFQRHDLELITKHNYSGEGWGLGSIDRYLVMSDGSNNLRIVNDTFSTVRTISVISNGIRVKGINDIEVVGDSVYMNVIDKDFILEFSMSKNKVVRVVKCRELLEKAAPVRAGSVLNGIAYHSKTDSFYVTGKYWKHMYNITIN